MLFIDSYNYFHFCIFSQDVAQSRQIPSFHHDENYNKCYSSIEINSILHIFQCRDATYRTKGVL